MRLVTSLSPFQPSAYKVLQHLPLSWAGSQKREYNPYNSIDRQTFRIPWMYTEFAHKGSGWPLMWVVTATKPSWQPHLEQEHEVVARDEYGVPMQVKRYNTLLVS